MPTCKTCKSDLDVTHFYCCPSQGFIPSSECKSCTRNRVKKNYEKNMQSPDWREKELLRQREKERRKRINRQDINSIGTNKKWRKRNPEKYKAHSALGNALRSGKILQEPCCKCGAKAQAHHDDYSKPLEVMWLCAKHHAERHIELRQLKEHGKIILPCSPTSQS